MLKRVGTVLGIAVLLGGGGCSPSSSRSPPASLTITACATTGYVGPSVSVELSAQEEGPAATVTLGEELVLPERPRGGRLLAAALQASTGAFCKRAQDASNLYLIAKRQGTFQLLIYFPSEVLFGNLAHYELMATVVVRRTVSGFGD